MSVPRSLWWMALLVSCTSPRWFAPRENRNGSSVSGAPAALYPLSSGDSVRGDLRLWSDGSAVEESGDTERTVLHVGFEIENTGSTPLALDLEQLRVERLWADDRTIAGLRPVRVDGDTAAPPGGRAAVQFWFEPGEGLRPRDIDAFDVRWRVRAEPDLAFDQITPFHPWVREDPWDDRWHYYGPGFGFGLGVGSWRWCR